LPRQPRTKAITRLYHVIIRGINKQDLFLDGQDYKKMINELINVKEKYEFELYSYVIMTNHVHLLIYDKRDNLSKTMQSLTIKYSLYFNKKYERVGHVFENRFNSKIIENKEYLRNLVRYIHKNPENAGLSTEYTWTSYKEYISKKKGIVTVKFILDLFGDTREIAINNFIYFHQNYDKKNDYNKDYELVKNINDEEAIKMMKELSNEENLLKIQLYEKNKRNSIIIKLLKIEGISKVQVSRILGISKRTIYNIEKLHEKKRP